MQGILFEYELNPTTWVYLSSLLIVGIYFKFRRFWSIRNLDLVGLIVFSPGLLLVYRGLQLQLNPTVGDVPFGQWLEQLGYIWLFSVGTFFLIRLLLDSVLVRRPLLEPNLSAGGLTFTGVALLFFLMSNVLNPKPAEPAQLGRPSHERLEHVLARQKPPVREGPGYPPFRAFARASNDALLPPGEADAEKPRPGLTQAITSHAAVIVVHLALLAGIVLIGYRHFDNIQTGVATATLYLLLPYTAQMTARVDHVIPATLLVWTVAMYRKPVVAGVLLALAAGLIYYPLYLLPLWCSFYWRRGLFRFAAGVIGMLALMALLLLLSPESLGTFGEQLRRMLGLMNPLTAELAGFWQYHSEVFRIPVLAAFVALCAGLALWPAQKNLGTLLSCSAAVMLGAQFWHAHQGGIHMAWYLPLLLLTVFRPNLEDRVAVAAVKEGWGRWRKARPSREDAGS